MTGEQREILIL